MPRDAPPVTLASVVPSESAETVPWTTVPGDQSDIINNSLTTPSFHRVLYLPSVLAEDMVTIFLKNLCCASRPPCPSTGHLVFICSLKAVTAK